MGLKKYGGECENGHVIALSRAQAVGVYKSKIVDALDRGEYPRTNKKVPARLCKVCRANRS